MTFKKGDILSFNYGDSQPDCKVICESTFYDDDWVHLLSADGTFVTYKRGYLLSQIAGGWIYFKSYAQNLKPNKIVTEFEFG